MKLVRDTYSKTSKSVTIASAVDESLSDVQTRSVETGEESIDIGPIISMLSSLIQMLHNSCVLTDKQVLELLNDRYVKEEQEHHIARLEILIEESKFTRKQKSDIKKHMAEHDYKGTFHFIRELLKSEKPYLNGNQFAEFVQIAHDMQIVI